MCFFLQFRSNFLSIRDAGAKEQNPAIFATVCKISQIPCSSPYGEKAGRRQNIHSAFQKKKIFPYIYIYIYIYIYLLLLLFNLIYLFKNK